MKLVGPAQISSLEYDSIGFHNLPVIQALSTLSNALIISTSDEAFARARVSYDHLFRQWLTVKNHLVAGLWPTWAIDSFPPATSSPLLHNACTFAIARVQPMVLNPRSYLLLPPTLITGRILNITTRSVMNSSLDRLAAFDNTLGKAKYSGDRRIKIRMIGMG